MKTNKEKIKKEKKPPKSRTKGTYKEYKYMAMQETWHKIKNDPRIKEKVNFNLYKKIMNTLNLEVLEEVLINPLGFQIPENLGSFQMIGLKHPIERPDLNQQLLARTDNYNYTIRHLTRKQSRPKNIIFFGFKLSDLAKKLIVRRIWKDDFFHLQKFRTKFDMIMANDKDNPETRVILAYAKKPKLGKEKYKELIKMVKQNNKKDDNKG